MVLFWDIAHGNCCVEAGTNLKGHITFLFLHHKSVFMKLNSFRNFNYYVQFFLECALFISVGHFGFTLFENLAVSIFLSFLFPFLAIGFWGTYRNSRSPLRLPYPHGYIFSVLGFGVGASMLHTTGKTVIALVFISVAFINQLILLYYEKRALKRS